MTAAVGPSSRLSTLAAHICSPPQEQWRLRRLPTSTAGSNDSSVNYASTTTPSLPPKTCWFIRHGQSETNVSEDWTQRDPALTALGRQQAKDVAFDPILTDALSGGVELVVVSPMLRTLQTATLALGAVPMLANSDIQETFPLPCDAGQPRSTIAPQFPHVNMSEIQEDWYDSGKLNPDGQRLLPLLAGYQRGDAIDDAVIETVRLATAARMQKWTAWLAARPETRIIIVAHQNVFAELFGLLFENCQVNYESSCRYFSLSQRCTSPLP